MTLLADVSHVSLRIDGQAAPPESLADLLEVSIDQRLHVPSMFTLRLHSHDMKWLENETFREGKTVEVFVGERPPIKLLSGKIAVLEPDLSEAAPSLMVRGYDLSHRLYRGRRRRSFTQVTDSDLARKLAGESGLRIGTVDDTSEVHEYIFQNNQSNAELLLDRARRLGYELWVDGDALNFRRPAPNGEPIQLAWADNLRVFRLRLSTAEQVGEVEVRGWNPKQKREVVGKARRGNGAPRIGLGQLGADVARGLGRSPCGPNRSICCLPRGSGRSGAGDARRSELSLR